VFDPAAVTIERSESMMRNGWMAYDAEGNVLQSGIVGIGAMKEREGIAFKIVCGVVAYDELVKMCKEKSDGQVT
jgi:hypothetical protein